MFARFLTFFKARTLRVAHLALVMLLPLLLLGFILFIAALKRYEQPQIPADASIAIIAGHQCYLEEAFKALPNYGHVLVTGVAEDYTQKYPAKVILGRTAKTLRGEVLEVEIFAKFFDIKQLVVVLPLQRLLRTKLAFGLFFPELKIAYYVVDSPQCSIHWYSYPAEYLKTISYLIDYGYLYFSQWLGQQIIKFG